MFNKIKSFFSNLSSDEKSSGKETGVVKRLYHNRGYGFISSPDREKRIFVHFKDTKSKIRVGNTVEFLVKETEKGPRATEVEVVG